MFDEGYRKAGKMGANRFSTSFALAEYAVMEAVNQGLVWSALAEGAGREWKDARGVRAELYGLNVSLLVSYLF